MSDKNRVLQDHLKKGNTFYPPFTFESGESRFIQVQWRADILPEIFWIALLISSLGFARAKELACGLGVLATSVETGGTGSNYGLMSGYFAIRGGSQEELLDALNRYGLIEDLRESLSPLIILFPKCPLSFIFSDTNTIDCSTDPTEIVGNALEECLYRMEKLPTLVQGIYYEVLLATGKMVLSGNVSRHNTSILIEEPEGKEAEKIAAYMRCCATSIPMEQKSLFGESANEWPKYFWSTAALIGECETQRRGGPYPNEVREDFLMYAADLFRAYSDCTSRLWEEIHDRYPYNTYWPLRDEILLGLATRIFRMTIQIVSFPPNWTEDVGQVYLRMVVESFIYFTWLKEHGTKDDFEKFYEYGLGQQKLRNEHTKGFLEANGMSKQDAEKMVDSMSFLRNHKFPDFVPVNVGNPLSKDLRRLAEDIDMKSLYSLVFAPTSSVVHGMYDALESYYLLECRNPFHCRHKIPYYWYKSPLSTFGVSNSLSVCDTVLSNLLEEVGADPLDPMPGAQYMRDLTDQEMLENFASADGQSERVKAMRSFLNAATERSESE